MVPYQQGTFFAACTVRIVMEKSILLSSAYLAPVEYYVKLFAYPVAYVECFDHYMKQTYRNRCVIASAEGPLSLTIPTEKGDEAKCLMKDIRISDHGNWRHVHWNAFVSAYKHSPFFDYYADEFHRFFEEKYEFLYDFNESLCRWVCRQIDIQPKLLPTKEYRAEVDGQVDFRERIHPKRSYVDFDKEFRPQRYYQVFDAKLGFIPNLSIIDLLFNMGPESLLVLRDSWNKENE